MEQGKNKNRVIILLIVIIAILTVLCVLFATGTISFKSEHSKDNIINNSSYDNNNTKSDKTDSYDNNNTKSDETDINENNSEQNSTTGENTANDNLNELFNFDNTRTLTEKEQKGLELYKYFVGTGTGPFNWKNNQVINYDEVISKMTKEYRQKFDDSSEANKIGFCIPYKENNVWKSQCGFGTAYVSVFKDIKVAKEDSCRIYYEITYRYAPMSDGTDVHEDTKDFVLKTNQCDQNDPDTDFSNGYKVDSFELIFGLQFK